jgi:hypothetical protein
MNLIKNVIKVEKDRKEVINLKRISKKLASRPKNTQK